MNFTLPVRLRDQHTPFDTSTSTSMAGSLSTPPELQLNLTACYEDGPDDAQHTPSFPFLRLPAELRNKIYSLVLTTERPILVSTPRRFKAKSMLALLSVCKQIRDEAREMFYAGNEFIFLARDDDDGDDDQSLEASSTLTL